MNSNVSVWASSFQVQAGSVKLLSERIISGRGLRYLTVAVLEASGSLKQMPSGTLGSPAEIQIDPEERGFGSMAS